MSRYHLKWLACLVAVFGMSACGKPTERLNSPPQGQADYPSELQPFFTYMVDAAMMSDVSIADIHFVPHTTELNSLGTTRLSRMAALLDTYGGTVRYAALTADEALAKERVAHVRDFLATTGVDVSRIDVTVAMAGSDHTAAERAMRASGTEQADKKADRWIKGQQQLWFKATSIGRGSGGASR